MFEFENTIFIQRSPQEVFDVLTDPAKAARWQTSTEAGEWTSDGPYGVGSTWKSKIKFMGREIESELEITEWESPSLVSFKTLDGPVPMEATNKLEAQENGTQLSLQVKVEFGGFFKMAEGLAGKQVVKQLENDNKTLKQLMESNQL
jgi:carbon monoxide dehydrogenase subunit G